MTINLRKTGIASVGDLPWGTHICQFYHTKSDLLEVLVPYFIEGLKNNEFCMWITAEPLDSKEAETEIRNAFPDFDNYLKKGQIEILSYKDWYLKGGSFNSESVLSGWITKLEKALKNGYDGLRLTGNTFWLEKKNWDDFTDYEASVNNIIGNYNILAICTYSLDKCDANEILDVVANHKFAIIKREGKWSVIHQGSELELEKSKERYENLFLNMIDGVAYNEVILDDSGKPVDYVFLDVNPAFERITGLKKESIIGKRATEVIPGIEKDSSDWIGKYGEVALSGKGILFEIFSNWLSKWLIVQASSNEKGRFISIFEDITERKRFEKSLEISKKNTQIQHEELQTIIDSAPSSIFYKDRENHFLRVNKAFCSMMGLPKEQLEGKSLFDIYSQEKAQAYWKDDLEVLAEGKPKLNILESVNTKNGIRWLQTHKLPYRDANGGVIGIIGFAVDITERKNAEEALKKSKELYQAVIENQTDLICRAKPDGTLTFVNDAYCRYYGKKQEEMIGTKYFSHLLPEDLAKEKEYLKSFSMRNPIQTIEHQAIAKGEIRWQKWNDRALFNKKGELEEFQFVGHDITERKNAEQALLSAKEDWERTFDSVPDLIAVLDTQHKITRLNKAMAKRLDAIPSECIGLNCFKCVHKLDKPPLSCPHALTLKDGKEHIAEIHEENLGGDFLITTTPIFDGNGKLSGSVHVARDITERKKFENELNSVNRALKALSACSQTMMHAENEISYLNGICNIIVKLCDHSMTWIGFVEHDKKKTVLPVAQAGFEKGYLKKIHISWADNEFGYGPTGTAIRTGKPAVCKNILDDPNFKPWRKEAIKRGYASSLVLPLITDKTVLGVLNIYSKQPDAFSDKEIKLLSELVDDVAYGIFSMRSRAERKKYESRIAHLATFPELNPIVIVELDMNGDTVYANPSTLELYPEIAQKGISHPLLSGIKPKLIKQNKIPVSREVSIGNKWYRQYVKYVPEVGNIRFYNTDITELKEAESALQESEKDLKHAQKVANVGSWRLDMEKNKLVWSEETYRIFGIKNGTSMSYELFISLVHPEDRDYVDQKWKAALRGERYDIEHRILVNGNVTYVREVAELEFKGKKLVAGFGTIQDITSHVKDRLVIKRALDEKEVLLKEIHHRVKNNLQVISSLLGIQAKTVKDPEFQRLINESKGRIKSMALIHEKIYESPDVKRIDLFGYLSSLTHSLGLSQENPRGISFTNKINGVFLEMGVAVPCCLILHELMTNSLKHAFPNGRKGAIEISSHYSPAKLTLIYRDDGVGIPKYITMDNSETLGLQLINTLINQVGGTIRLNRKKGIEFVIEIPIKEIKLKETD